MEANARPRGLPHDAYQAVRAGGRAGHVVRDRAQCQLPPICEPPVSMCASMAGGEAADAFNALGAHCAQRGGHRCGLPLGLGLGPYSDETRLDLLDWGSSRVVTSVTRRSSSGIRKFSRRSLGFFQARMAYGTALALLGKHQAAAEEFMAAQHWSPQSDAAALCLRTRGGQRVGQKRQFRTSESFPNCDRAGAPGDLALASASVGCRRPTRSPDPARPRLRCTRIWA